MKLGQLRDIVDIQENVSSDDDGQPAYQQSSTLFANVPCAIETTSGYETYRGRQLEAGTSHIVTCNYLPDITPAMRLKCVETRTQEEYLHIVAVRPVDFNGRVQYLELHCKAKTGV